MLTKKFPESRSNYQSGIYIAATVLLFMFFYVGSSIPASAHTSVQVKNITIDVGWGTEPPIVELEMILSSKL
jgi:hypothetical protein